MEWVHDHNHGDARLVFSKKHKVAQSVRYADGKSQESGKGSSRKKAGGLLRYSVHSLKKVARLLGKDQSEVLKILRKKVREREGKDMLK